MKKMILVLAVLFAGATLLAGPAFSETVRIATGEWAPFTSKDLKHGGVANHIVKEAFKLVGIDTEFGYFPWARSLQYVMDGKWDATGFWSPNTEWEDKIYHSDPIGEIKFVFFHRKDNPFDWKSVADLIKNKTKIGLTLGYNYENPEFKKEYSEGGKLEKQVQWVSSDEKNFRMLLGGRFDAFPQEISVGFDMIRKMFSTEEAQLITVHPKPLTVTPATLLLSKKVKRNARMFKLFNKGLKQLKDSGRYDQMYKDSMAGKYIIK